MYGHAPQMMHQEFTFFTGGGVQVTSARFVVYGQMYPLGGITSVSPFTIPPVTTRLYVWGTLCALLALCSLPLLFSAGNPGGLVIFGAIAGLCFWSASKRKATHGVMISTAGMQVRALTSQDLAFVQQVVGALHQAVASR